tara:strand:+ start:302 stop:835 length:534 start_codon:yes stop_codon:yes gene_type:complete
MYYLTKGFFKWAKHKLDTSILNKTPITTCSVDGFEATVEKKTSSDFEELKAKASLPDSLSVDCYYEVKLHSLNTNKNYQKRSQPLTFIFTEATKVSKGAVNNGVMNWPMANGDSKWVSIDFSEEETKNGEPAIWITSKEKSVSFDRSGYSINTYEASNCCLSRGEDRKPLTLERLLP